MNGRNTSSSPFISESVKNTPEHLMQQFNTYEKFCNLIFLSRKSQMLENEESVACV